MKATRPRRKSKGSQCGHRGSTQEATQTDALTLVSSICQTEDMLPGVEDNFPAKTRSALQWMITVRQAKSMVSDMLKTLPEDAQQVIRLKGINLGNTCTVTEIQAARPAHGMDPLHTAVCCVKCCQLFTRRDDANRHWQLYHAAEPAEEPQGPHHCLYCSFSSSTMMTVLQHEKLHTREELYAYRFYQHPPHRNSYICGVCQKRAHTTDKPFRCIRCSERFSWKSNLDAHQKALTHGKPYGCRFCPQYWYRKHDRDVHERRHLCGHALHVCSRCQKHCSRKQYLAAHEMVRTGKGFFTCGICQEGFAREVCLRAHAKTHSGKRPTIHQLSVTLA